MANLTVNQFIEEANGTSKESEVTISNGQVITTGVGMRRVGMDGGARYLCEAGDLYRFMQEDELFDGEFNHENVFAGVLEMNAMS